MDLHLATGRLPQNMPSPPLSRADPTSPQPGTPQSRIPRLRTAGPAGLTGSPSPVIAAGSIAAPPARSGNTATNSPARPFSTGNLPSPSPSTGQTDKKPPAAASLPSPLATRTKASPAPQPPRTPLHSRRRRATSGPVSPKSATPSRASLSPSSSSATTAPATPTARKTSRNMASSRRQSVVSFTESTSPSPATSIPPTTRGDESPRKRKTTLLRRSLSSPFHKSPTTKKEGKEKERSSRSRDPSPSKEGSPLQRARSASVFDDHNPSRPQSPAGSHTSSASKHSNLAGRLKATLGRRRSHIETTDDEAEEHQSASSHYSPRPAPPSDAPRRTISQALAGSIRRSLHIPHFRYRHDHERGGYAVVEPSEGRKPQDVDKSVIPPARRRAVSFTPRSAQTGYVSSRHSYHGSPFGSTASLSETGRRSPSKLKKRRPSLSGAFNDRRPHSVIGLDHELKGAGGLLLPGESEDRGADDQRYTPGLRPPTDDFFARRTRARSPSPPRSTSASIYATPPRRSTSLQGRQPRKSGETQSDRGSRFPEEGLGPGQLRKVSEIARVYETMSAIAPPPTIRSRSNSVSPSPQSTCSHSDLGARLARVSDSARVIDFSPGPSNWDASSALSRSDSEGKRRWSKGAEVVENMLRARSTQSPAPAPSDGESRDSDPLNCAASSEPRKGSHPQSVLSSAFGDDGSSFVMVDGENEIDHSPSKSANTSPVVAADPDSDSDAEGVKGLETVLEESEMFESRPNLRDEAKTVEVPSLKREDEVKNGEVLEGNPPPPQSGDDKPASMAGEGLQPEVAGESNAKPDAEPVIQSDALDDAKSTTTTSEPNSPILHSEEQCDAMLPPPEVQAAEENWPRSATSTPAPTYPRELPSSETHAQDEPHPAADTLCPITGPAQGVTNISSPLRVPLDSAESRAVSPNRKSLKISGNTHKMSRMGTSVFDNLPSMSSAVSFGVLAAGVMMAVSGPDAAGSAVVNGAMAISQLMAEMSGI